MYGINDFKIVAVVKCLQTYVQGVLSRLWVDIIYSKWTKNSVSQAITFSFLLPDINKCASNNGDCAHNCMDIAGSFPCSCRAGFQLNTDQLTCSGMIV